MSATALYRPGTTLLHRLDPRAKLIAVLAVLVVALTTTRFDVLVALIVLVFAGLYGLGRIGPRSYGRAMLAAVPLIALLTLLQGLLQPGEVLVHLGNLSFSRQGALLGLGIGLRLLAMVVCFYGFAATTSPTAISLAVHRFGVPYKYAYLASFAFRFLPLMQDEARTLITAMAVRGSPDGTSRSLPRRIRGVLRILFPMLVGALRRSEETALAMELRGYGLPGPRTFLRPLRFTARDGAFLTILLALAAALVAVQFLVPDLLVSTGG